MTNSLSNLAGVGAILVVFLLLSSVGSVITYIIIVVANRADPDPTGKRPMAVYLFGGAFLTLWLAYVGGIATATGLIGLIGRKFSSGSGIHPVGDAAVREITLGLLLVLVAGGAHLLHRRRGFDLANSEQDPASPTKRVARSYVAVVSFVTVIIAIFTLFAFLFTLLGIIAPGVYHAAGRMVQLRILLTETFILLLTAWIFRSHQAVAPRALQLFGGSTGQSTFDVVEVVEIVE